MYSRSVSRPTNVKRDKFKTEKYSRQTANYANENEIIDQTMFETKTLTKKINFQIT